MGASLAEIVVLAAAVWFVARLLEPLRRLFERKILRLISPERASIIDAEILSPSKKPQE